MGRPSKKDAIAKLKGNSKYKSSVSTLDLGGDLIELKVLPLQLRKVAKFMLKNGADKGLKGVCIELDVKYNSVTSAIYTLKKKGIDFNKFLEAISSSYLDASLVDVDAALIKGATDGSHNHQKLYYQRTNKINSDQNINVTVLSVGVSLAGDKPQDTQRVKGVIDLNPVIPNEDDDIFDG